MHQLRTRSIHIVKRYGSVGGMERYVWELTHHLAGQGHQVVVICEQQYETLRAGSHLYDIQVIQVGAGIRSFPRWINMLLFSGKIHRKLSSMETERWVIHSHERTCGHDVTTFHGCSIEARNHSVFDGLSPRLHAWTWLERREICGSSVQCIVPVSEVSRKQILDFYPQSAQRIAEPAFPGVSDEFFRRKNLNKGQTIGFVGKEWRRKGLDLLVNSVKRLREKNPSIQLWVAGCESDDVQHLFRDWQDGFKLLGWVDPVKLYADIDLLVLPSRNEPFGMVVAEANAAGLPVVVSNRCGIAPLIGVQSGRVISLNQPLQLDHACRSMLMLKNPVLKLNLHWDRVANQYAEIYRKVCNRKVSLDSHKNTASWSENLRDWIHHGDRLT